MPDFILWRGFQVLSFNIPEDRSGAYRFENLENGKCYNGISVSVERRIKNSGNNYQHGAKKFDNAIKKYGKLAFLFTPIFYLVKELNEHAIKDIEDKRKDTAHFLSEIEADHILITDSVKNGYNIIAAYGGVGPYGHEFSEIMSIAVKASHASDPTLGKRKGEALKATLAANPLINERRGIALKIAHAADPTIGERIGASIKATLAADPTINERRNASIKATLAADPTIIEQRVISRKATLAADPKIGERIGALLKATLAADPTIGERRGALLKAKLAANPIILERRIAAYKVTCARRRIAKQISKISLLGDMLC